jgi:hypothetical protein
MTICSLPRHSCRGALASIPAANTAIIVPEKLRDYVLSPTHPVGRFKAVFFAKLGYSQDAWQRLADDLRAQHLPIAATSEATPYGVKYRIVGPLTGPAGRSAMVVSVWMVRANGAAPHLVTLFPGGP